MRSWQRSRGVAVLVALSSVLVAVAGLVGGTPSAVAAGCPNEDFRTGFGTQLPDCRAYEQASPVDKNGNPIEGWIGLLQAAEDGSGATYFSQAGTSIPAEGGATQDFPTFLASRSSGSWTNQRLLVPQQYGEQAHYLGSTPNLRYAVVEAFKTARGTGLFAIDTVSHSVVQIAPYSSQPFEFNNYAFDGASADGSRFFFESRGALTGGAFGESNIYMWDRSSGTVSLVGVLPGPSGEGPEAGSFGGAYEWFEFAEPFLGGAIYGNAVQAAHAISPTGDQVYFTAGETGQLYLRRGLTGPSPNTVHVSEPNPGVTDPTGSHPAAFQEATPSGRFAFFRSSQQLTADATSGGGNNLYRWDATTEELTDVAPDAADPNGPEIQGLLGISSDGTRGYFAANADLAPGATAGETNLYRFVESVSGFTVSFVAPLRPADKRNWSPKMYENGQYFAQGPAKLSRTSADGETLLFTSQGSLTGFDNEGERCKTSGIPEEFGPGGQFLCAEIYRYSVGSGLSCISCDRSNQGPVGPADFQTYAITSLIQPTGIPSVVVPRNLSADGNRVFFQTPDPLVAADTNGASGCPRLQEQANQRPLCQDVYEWEAAGTAGGSCEVAEAAGGCLYLLSTGQSEEPSYFIDASSDGSNVFIATSERLVPSDSDDALDVYAVRVDGGLASQHIVASPPCVGESCLGAPLPAPSSGSPGSSALQGPGNQKQKKPKHKKHHKKRSKHKQQQKTVSPSRGGAK